MYHLIYKSEARQNLSFYELSILIGKIRLNNYYNNVTGILLYQNRILMQMIEGDRDCIIKLFKKICSDRRHFNFKELSHGYIDKRNYEHFSMAFVNLDFHTDLIGDEKMLSNFDENHENPYRFMVDFYSNFLSDISKVK